MEPEVHCRNHKDSPIIPILSRMNSTFAIISISVILTLTMSSHLRLGLPMVLPTVGLPVKTFEAFLPSFIPSIYPIHLNLLDLIGLALLDERDKVYKLRSFPL